MKKIIHLAICCLFGLAFMPATAFAEYYPDSDPHHGNVHRPARPHEEPPHHKHTVTEEEIAAHAAVDTAVTVASVLMTAPIPNDDVYHFGMDLRIAGAAATDLKTGFAIGADLWVRPIRWVSIELYTDLVFNGNKTLAVQNEKSFDSIFRIPVYLGVRVHAFDYAAYNVYAAVAGGVNIQYLPIDKKGVGGGIQVGLGASSTIYAFHIGADVRYTLESLYSNFNRNVIHGCIFSLNIGFAR